MRTALSLILALGLAASTAGCANLTAQQQANLQLQLALAKQIGADAVQIWCSTSNIIYVIANDVAAESRVTNALQKNAKAATDACPMIAAGAGIQVTTAAQAPTVAITK